MKTSPTGAGCSLKRVPFGSPSSETESTNRTPSYRRGNARTLTGRPVFLWTWWARNDEGRRDCPGYGAPTIIWTRITTWTKTRLRPCRDRRRATDRNRRQWRRRRRRSHRSPSYCGRNTRPSFTRTRRTLCWSECPRCRIRTSFSWRTSRWRTAGLIRRMASRRTGPCPLWLYARTCRRRGCPSPIRTSGSSARWTWKSSPCRDRGATTWASAAISRKTTMSSPLAALIAGSLIGWRTSRPRR